MSFILLCGTWSRCMKKMVFVSVFRPGIPCARCPISFPYKCTQTDFVFGLLIRCRYSRSLPFSPRTELAISQNHVIGILQDDNCLADISKTGFLFSIWFSKIHPAKRIQWCQQRPSKSVGDRRNKEENRWCSEKWALWHTFVHWRYHHQQLCKGQLCNNLTDVCPRAWNEKF